ncbi:hypothetical protein [Nonomuraea endophytica]|uniref:hypothetical protein n=1 Tax=Nonomuraea endophytica TaxID=714136 RepID=UPI0037CA9AAA
MTDTTPDTTPITMTQPDLAFEAADVPALRRDLLAWVRDGRGHAFHSLMSLNAGTLFGRPDLDGHRGLMRSYAGMLCAQEARTLAEAELYYVTGEMTAIVHAAAETMPAFAPSADDFPTTSGFIVFQQPLLTCRRPEHTAAVFINGRLAVDARDKPYEDVDIIACSWGPWNAGGQWTHGGVFMSFYRDRRAVLEGLVDDRLAAGLRSDYAPLVPDNEYGIAFDPARRAQLEQELTEHDNLDYTSHWAKRLLTTLLLMRQPLIYQRTEPIRRGLRRQLERAGQPTRDILILDARPRRYETTATPSAPGEQGHGQADESAPDVQGRKLAVRVPVRGFWRNQWYPSRQVHRPLWIDPHWRGPEDAPIVHPERVRVLRHHPDQDGAPTP